MSKRLFRQGGIYAAHRKSYLRGVAFSGGEYSFANHFYPTQAGANLMAARGMKLGRLATKWEYLQPVLNGPLDSTEVGKLTTALNYLAAAGQQVVLEPHNYGDYKTADGVTHQLNDADGVVTNAKFQDYWTRIATQFGSHPAVYGYELMNEPRQMFGAYTATGPDLINANGFETGIPGNINVVNGTAARTSAAARDGSSSLAITATAAGDVKVQFKGIPVSATQTYDFHAYFLKGSGTARTVHVGLLCYGSTGTLLNVNEQITGGFFSDSSWVAIQGQGKPLSATTTVDLQFTIRSAAAGEVHYMDMLTMVPTAGVVTAARGWEISAQAAVDAIRAVDTTKMLWIPTYEWQSVSRVNVNHPNGPWIVNGGPVRYAGHLYYDFSGSGVYTNSYAADNTSAVNAGFASLQAYVLSRLATFTTWLHAAGARGVISETGWTWASNSDQPLWQAIGEAFYQACDAAELDVTYWFSGSYSSGTPGSATTAYNYAPGVATSVYPQATVIEAHPSIN